MEFLENNLKSKMTEKVTLELLLNFIKNNTSRLQPKNEFITEKVVEKVIPKVPEKKVKDTNSIDLRELLSLTNKEVPFCPAELSEILSKINEEINIINVYFDTDNDKNFSFLNAVKFYFDELKDQLVNILISGLKRFIQYGGFTDCGYSKLKWNKKDINKSIDSNLIDKYFIRSLADYLHINILILENTTNEFISLDNYSVDKKHIVLYKIDNTYYPVFNNKTKYFTSTSPFINYFLHGKEDEQGFIKKLVSNVVMNVGTDEIMSEVNVDPSLILTADLQSVDLQSVVNGFDDYSSEDEKDKNDKNNSESDNDGNNDEESTTDNKIKLKIDYSKLSYKELQDLAKKYSIPIKRDGKLLTKDKLCLEIEKKK